MRNHSVKTFIYGSITSIEDRAIKDGAASNALNWQTKADHIELRRGYKIIGTEQNGAGKVTGLHVTSKADQSQILYAKRGRKLLYYDEATEDFAETGSNIFPALAANDDMSFDNYTTLAGNQMFFSSPNSSIYKIMSANPGDYSDQYNSAKNFKGRIFIKQNRTFLLGRNEDKTGIYGSYIDTASYTTVTAEARHNGDGSTKTFTGTLAFKGSTRRTCFAVTFTDGIETFTDDYNGVLTGSLGGTGTINYMTGAYSITFTTAPLVGTNNITATYQWEDATNNGIMDFTKSPTRLAGQGFVFRQDDGGGNAQAIATINDVEYCFHEFKTWELTLSATDTNATNLIYRQNVGIPNWRAAVATGDGIYYVDDLEQSNPKFRLMTFIQGNVQVIPIPISDNLNLTDYRFDKAATIEYGDLILFACRDKDSTENNRIFAYDKRYKSWDLFDYYVSCFAIYNGALIVGESISENVVEIFSGFDDNDSTIPNYWDGNLSDLEIENLKKAKELWIQGEMSRDQILEIYAATDKGSWVLIGTQRGTDSNVDTTSSRNVIGSNKIGNSVIGGQGSTNVYNYVKKIKFQQGKFQLVKIRFKALGIGYCSVSTIDYHDIILYQNKLPQKYRS